MEYRALGSSGLKVSAVGLGTNQFGGKVDQSGVDAIIGSALDQGINFIDTADIYTGGRSEETLGRALATRRDQVIIATKVGMKAGDGPNQIGAARQHIMDGVHASLRRLSVDHIDLYQIHRFDPTTPAEETMRALDDLVTAGKVRYLGASNYAAWQLVHANEVASHQGWSRFVSIQPHYNMLTRTIEAQLVPCCKAFNIGILPFFPLAGGFLSGKYERNKPAPEGSRGENNGYVKGFMTDATFDIIESLTSWAAERGHTMLELAIAWLLAQPQMSSVISGATRPEQVVANANAAEWTLSAEEEQEVRKILEAEQA